MKSLSADVLRRWRPIAIAVLATTLVVAFPSHHGGAHHGPAGVTTGPAEATTSTTAAAPSATTEAGPSPLQSGTAARTATTLGAAAASGTKSIATGAKKNTTVSGLDTRAVASAAVQTSAGINTPAALAAPDCDAASKKLKISFTWRPACVIPWPAGSDNGGATYQGVTADSIRVVRYNNYLGNPPQTSNSDMKAKWQTSIDLFQHFYRMWGRKIENIVIDETGPDEVSQRADAVKIASAKPFAAIGVPATATVLIGELVARKIVVITTANISVKMSLAFQPYVWGVTIQPDELVELNAAEYAGKRLLGKPAHWAGEADYQVLPRKWALIHPDTWDVKLFTDAFSKYGGVLTDEVSYQSGQQYASSWAERSATIAAKLKNDGITTVIAGTDLLFTGPMTTAAAGQNWFPEWVVTSYSAQDLDVVAATYNQAEWAHAFGTGGIPIAGNQPWPEYWFYNWYWGNKGNQDGPAQSEAPVLFSGIHGAGPHLTPETFRDGVFALPPSGGPATGGIQSAQFSFGHWGFFPWDDYNAFDDFDELYWDATAIAPDLVTGQQTAGHYRHMNGGKRYMTSQWPTGEPPMFNSAGTAMWYDKYPPGDVPPNFPCTGCPSTS